MNDGSGEIMRVMLGKEMISKQPTESFKNSPKGEFFFILGY